jgi:hypothetical protein
MTRIALLLLFAISASSPAADSKRFGSVSPTASAPCS